MSDKLSKKDSQKIVDEMIHGTPNTPKRVETLKRADKVYADANPSSTYWMDTATLLGKDLQRLIMVLAKIGQADYGGNGRCFWCDGWPRGTHRDDCPSVTANKALAETFPKVE